MTIGLVEQEWREFESHTIPPRAGDPQRKDMRRAFYAGAFAILQRTAHALSEGDAMTPADDAIMEGVAKEFDDFADAVKAGRA